MLEAGYEFIHIVLGIETEPAHAGIQLDMNGQSRNAFLLGSLDKGVEQSERIHLRFEVIVEHRLEGGHLRVHDHDVARDTILAQRNALVRHSHGQIVHTVVLQRLGYFHRTSPIAVGLDHADELGVRLHERAVVVEVGHHGIEVYLEGCLVHLPYQEFSELVETELACAF